MRKAGLFKIQWSDFAVKIRQLGNEKELAQAGEMADYSGIKIQFGSVQICQLLGEKDHK